jgi:formate-dependent nitrite reductase cytochrome c552 subunit
MTMLWRTTALVGTGSFALVAALSVGDMPSYVGAKKCKMCHSKQYKSWEQTKMAQTFAVLKPGVRAEEKKKANFDPQKDYTSDRRCLPCHTTGYGRPGGFVSLGETPHLAGVQCEACHGPASEYLKEGRMTLKNPKYKRADLLNFGLVVPGEQTCVSVCHNSSYHRLSDSPYAGKDYVFDYEERKGEKTHEHFPLKHPH